MMAAAAGPPGTHSRRRPAPASAPPPAGQSAPPPRPGHRGRAGAIGCGRAAESGRHRMNSSARDCQACQAQALRSPADPPLAPALRLRRQPPHPAPGPQDRTRRASPVRASTVPKDRRARWPAPHRPWRSAAGLRRAEPGRTFGSAPDQSPPAARCSARSPSCPSGVASTGADRVPPAMPPQSLPAYQGRGLRRSGPAAAPRRLAAP